MVTVLSSIRFIAIDVNVFGQIACQHILQVLTVLQKEGIGLLVDDKGLISGEYDRHLGKERFMENPVYANEAYIMTYWLLPDIRKCIAMDCSDHLAKGIKDIVGDKEKEDRAYIYVAAKEDSLLISNDKKHIINNREKLYGKLSNKIRILKSWEMFEELKNGGQIANICYNSTPKGAKK